ncbi:MAG: T9SS type A sorting domain-containing protein, partial [Thermoanaerobaculia bacterium]|nr:T9SS type A sorting domain-containing protein [Thermoanaerobaculia bacterium]
NKALTAAEIAKLYQTGTTGAGELDGNVLRSVVLGLAPNPVADRLTVQHAFPNNQDLLIRVFDMQGRQVDHLRFDKNEIPAGQFSLNAGHYPQGTYSLNFILGGKNLGAVQFNKQ